MSAKEELMNGLYDLLNREYDQMISYMLQGSTISYDIPLGKKYHSLHFQHSGDKLLAEERKANKIPPTLELKATGKPVEPIMNTTTTEEDVEEEEEEDWDTNFSDTGDSMNKKFFGDKLQLPNLRTVPVKTIDQLNVDDNEEEEIDFDAVDNGNEGISSLCGIRANPDDQGDDWGDDFDFVSDLTPAQFTQQLNKTKSPITHHKSVPSSHKKGNDSSSSSSSSSGSSSSSSTSSKSSSSSSSSISDIMMRTPGVMERSLSFCSTSTNTSTSSSAGNTPKPFQRRQTVSQKPEIPVLPVAKAMQTTGFLSPIKCGNLKSPRDEYKHEDDELFEEFALIKSFLKRVDTLRKDAPTLSNKSISEISQCLLLKNGMPIWFDQDKPITNSPDIIEAVSLWKRGLQLTLDSDYSGAIESHKRAVSHLDESDPYSKETDLSILKAYILLDMSVVSARQENHYNQTEYLRQAEFILQNIPDGGNEKWARLASLFKTTAWYALAMCFSEANMSLALKYSIKHNQSVLYRRGSSVYWNSVAKGCCMAGALISDVNKSLSLMCLQRALEAAKLANNDSLMYLIMPFVEAEQSASHKSEQLGMSESSGLEDRSSLPTARTVAGVYGSDSNEDEDENWDVEFGIETNMEHFSLNDNMKSSSSSALHSRPSIPPQYKLTERLLKPMPTVTNYLRTTHLYSIKTKEGHSSIPEQKFSEWLRTITKRQYEKQYGGYKTLSIIEAMENHQKRLQDKVYTENFLSEYAQLCGGLSNAGRYDECWKVIRELATVVKDYVSLPEITHSQRKLAFTTVLVALWIGLDSWSITRYKVFCEVRDIMVDLFPSTAKIFTDIELEGYAHAEVTGNTTEMELWEEEEEEGRVIDPMQNFGELYIKAKNEPPAADQLFADCRLYILTCCLSNMCVMALGISPVSYNLNMCTQREPDFYGTVIDEVGDIADIADFNDADGAAPELHSLRTRIAELYRIYPAIQNSNIVKSRAAFTLGVWELARRNNDRAEELLFEALYLMSNNDTSTQNIIPPCTNIGLQTHMLYGNLLLRGSRYMYASACYESAIMMCRLQQRKEYFMIARHAAEAAHKNDDIDRCIAIYNELYVAYMDKGRTNEGVYVLLILLDIYKQIGDFGEAEKAIRDAYATLSIPPSSINGNTAGGNNGQASEGSSPMITSLTGSQQSGSSSSLPQMAQGQVNTGAGGSSTVNNTRTQALLDLEIKFCELFLSSQLYEKGFVLLSELWRRDIPQRSKRDAIAMLAAEAFAERGLLREVMYFFSAMSKHDDPQQPQAQQQIPTQDVFGTTLNMTSANTIMVSGGPMLKRAQILIRAFQASGNYLEGFEFVEATIHSYESTGFPSTKTKADLYYTRGIFLHNIFKRGKSIGYPRKLKASEGFRKAFYNEAYFPYCSKDCDLQTFYRNTDILQEAIATYVLAVDLYQVVSDDLSIIKCRLSSTELILNYMITSKTELDSSKDTFSMGSDFGTSSNSSNSEDEEESFAESSCCSLNKPLSFPYFETKAQNSSYRNRNGRFTVSIESLQEFLFSALESSLDNMCILWYIESLLNIAELRIIQNEIEGSMSYWKEAKNLFFLFFMDPPLLLVRKWPTTLLEPVVNIIMRICRILMNYDGEFINNNLIVLDSGVLAQEDLAISRHRPIPSALFSFDLLATPTSILSGELNTDYEGFVSSDKDLIPEIGDKVYLKFAKTQELAATVAEAEYKRENGGIKTIITDGGSYSPTSGTISGKGLFTRRENFIKKTAGINVKDLLQPETAKKFIFYEDNPDKTGAVEEDLGNPNMDKGTKRRTRSMNDMSERLAAAFGDGVDLEDDAGDDSDSDSDKAGRQSSSSSTSPMPQSSSSSSSSSSEERSGFDTPGYEEASQVMLGLMCYMGYRLKDMMSHGNLPKDQVRKSLMDIVFTFIQCADAGRVKEDFLSRGLANFYKRKKMNSGTLEFTENTLYALNIDSTVIFYSPATMKTHYTRLENVHAPPSLISSSSSSSQPIPGLLSSAKPVVTTTQVGKKVLKGGKGKDFVKVKLRLMLTEDYVVMKVPRKMTLGVLIADICDCYNDNVFTQVPRRTERYSSGSSSSSGKKKPRLSVSSTSSSASGKKAKTTVVTDAKASTPQAPPLPINPIADAESIAAANAASSSPNNNSGASSEKGHSKHRHHHHHRHHHKHKREHSRHNNQGVVKLCYTSKNGVQYLSSTQDFKKHCLALEHNVAENNRATQQDSLKKRKPRARDKTKLSPDDFTIAKLPKCAASNINYYNTAQCTLSTTEIIENAVDGDSLSAPGAGGDGERKLFLCRQQRQLRPNVTMSTRPLAISMDIAILMRKIVYGSFVEEGQMEENVAACKKCSDEFASVMHGAKDVIAGPRGKINPSSPVIVVSSYSLRGIPFELVFRENSVLRAASFSDLFYSQYAAKHGKKDIYLPKYVVFTYQSGREKLMKYKEINRKKYLLKLVKYSMHIKETIPILSYLTDSTQLFNSGYKKSFMMKYKLKCLKVFNLDKLAANNTNTDNDYLTICDEINFTDAYPLLVVTYPDIVNCSSTLINVIRKNPNVVIVAVPRTCFSKVMKVILQEHENCVRMAKENPYLRTRYGFFSHLIRSVMDKLSIPIPVFNPPIPVFSKLIKQSK